MLWIGCSDSPVPVNTITQTKAGEVFAQRNVGNIVAANDWNLSAVPGFSINHPHISEITSRGHYGRDGIRALDGDIKACFASRPGESSALLPSHHHDKEPFSAFHSLCPASRECRAHRRWPFRRTARSCVRPPCPFHPIVQKGQVAQARPAISKVGATRNTPVSRANATAPARFR
ncbi:MAG: carbonic anhydrase [Candidatus Dechloromonas phosphoritropha]